MPLRDHPTLAAAGDGPIPTFVVVGFLGSGKTTLMSHLLDEAIAGGVRVGLVVNDFDEFNVDAHLLQGKAGGGNVLELPGGCMCCQLGDDLAESLNTLLSLRRFDLFLIETSGLAEPLEVIHQLTAPSLLPVIVPRLMVAVIDIEAPPPADDGPRLVWEQVRASRVVLLNKADRIDRAELDRAAERLRRHSPNSEVLITAQARVDLGLLLDHAGELAPPAAEHRHLHLHASFNSFAAKLPEPVERAAFERYLNGLPEAVVRAKGFVRFSGEAGTFFFNRVGSFVQVAPLREGGQPPVMMVCIGRHIDAEALRRALNEQVPRVEPG